MALIDCAECGKQISDQANSCPNCGAPIGGKKTNDNSTDSTVSVSGQVFVLIGSFALVIGPFLPWATAGIFSASGLQKTNSEALIICILGVLSGLPAIISLVKKKNVGDWASLICGLIAGGLAVFYYVGLRDTLSGMGGGMLSPSIGSGIYVCFAGTGAIVVGIIASSVSSGKKSHKSNRED